MASRTKKAGICLGLIFTLFSYMTPVWSGPSEGGGSGHVVEADHLKKPMFLDLYVHLALNPGHNQFLLPDDPSSSSQLPETRAYKVLGLSRLNSREFRHVKKATELINNFANKNNLRDNPVIRALLDGVHRAPLFYTSHKISTPLASFWSPPNFKFPVAPRPIAFYLPQFGILVSKSDFDSLDYTSQVALIIHETFRHLRYNYKIFGYLDDQQIQELTAAITLGLINSDASNFDLLSTRKTAKLEFDKVLSETCATTKKYENFFREKRNELKEFQAAYCVNGTDEFDGFFFPTNGQSVDSNQIRAFANRVYLLFRTAYYSTPKRSFSKHPAVVQLIEAVNSLGYLLKDESIDRIIGHENSLEALDHSLIMNQWSLTQEIENVNQGAPPSEYGKKLIQRQILSGILEKR